MRSHADRGTAVIYLAAGLPSSAIRVPRNRTARTRTYENPT